MEKEKERIKERKEERDKERETSVSRIFKWRLPRPLPHPPQPPPVSQETVVIETSSGLRLATLAAAPPAALLRGRAS